MSTSLIPCLNTLSMLDMSSSDEVLLLTASVQHPIHTVSLKSCSRWSSGTMSDDASNIKMFICGYNLVAKGRNS
eukprot:397518-Hanusia_phi.AAC.1